MPTKNVNFRTNYNNKLDCPYFVHLDVAPTPGSVTESALENTLIIINTIDGSHPPVKTKLHDLARFPLKELSENMVYLSHGMKKDDFIDLMMKKSGVTPDTEMALYYYHKELPSC